ncbi:MAG TPA: hypothetical protein VNA25_17720 [Phycisphaerae bacterium]|nr:hypothetical protein [Phycisphaerae bacterium]
MRKLGSVVAILNDQLLLITSEEKLEPEQILTVFAESSDPKLADSTGLASIAYPKGELRVICAEEGNVYLAERFREVTQRKRKITVPSPFQIGLRGLAAQLQPETKEIVEDVPGPWSADLDQEQALGLTFEKTVHVGDPIGRM